MKNAFFKAFLGLCCGLGLGLHADDWGVQVKAAVEAQKQGDLKGAESKLLKALYETQRYGSDDPRAAYTLDYLGTLYQQMDNQGDSLRVFAQASKAFDASRGPHSDEALASCRRLAEALEKAEQWPDAEPQRRRLLEEAKQAPGHDPIALAQAEADLGLNLDAQKKWDEAMPLYDDALKLRTQGLGEESGPVAEILNDQGRVWLLKGNAKRAEQLIRKAAAIDEKVLGPADPSLGDDYQRLAAVLRKAGKDKDAQAAQDRADAIVAAVEEKEQGPRPHAEHLPAPPEDKP
ncbi:MAG TPA: tetratricopeptide repeat protein [bacterium]|nr:tetratricopeptide repeat protein [bacterium]